MGSVVFVRRKRLAAAAAFPAIEGTNTSGEVSPVTSHDISLPASIQAGELLIILFSHTNGLLTASPPTGWDDFLNFEDGSSSGVGFNAFWKEADGSEGATAIATTSGSVLSAHNSYRISGWQGTPEGQTANGTSANPDPPSVTPSWGATKTLWLACCNSRKTGTPALSVDATPANYTDSISLIQKQSGLNNWVSMTSLRRELEAASENPGTFTLNASLVWIAATIAVRPA